MTQMSSDSESVKEIVNLPHSLVIKDLSTLKALRLPKDCWRDHKKLTSFLENVEKTLN
jgi:hypothetical protein